MVTPLLSTCTPINSCGQVKPTEALTYGDIQVAIWTLIEDSLPDNLSDFAAILPWSQDRVDAILCDVNANGEGFIPTCDEKTAFIVVSDSGDVQIITAQTQISSTGLSCETTVGCALSDGLFGARYPGSTGGDISFMMRAVYLKNKVVAV